MEYKLITFVIEAIDIWESETKLSANQEFRDALHAASTALLALRRFF